MFLIDIIMEQGHLGFFYCTVLQGSLSSWRNFLPPCSHTVHFGESSQVIYNVQAYGHWYMYGLSKNTLVMGRQIITSHSHKRMILSTWPTQYHFAGIICSKYFKWMTVKGQYPMGARCTHMHTTHWGVYRIWANGIHSLRTILC